jgi:hypothetical protein
VALLRQGEAVLDPALKAFEQAAVTAVTASMAALFGAGAITRRALRFEPPATSWYAWNITVRPVESTGHPLATLDATVEVEMRTFGRDIVEDTVIFDRVRFLSEMAFERVIVSPDARRLFDQPESSTYEIDGEIEDGPVVLIEKIVARVKVRDVLAAGAALGIVANFEAAFAAGATARATLSSPVVHHQGLDQIVLTEDDEGEQVANVVALWAGAAGDESETLELVPYDGGAAVDTFTLAAAAGSHTFAGVAAGTYLLRIVDGSGTRSESLPVRVLEAP